MGLRMLKIYLHYYYLWIFLRDAVEMLNVFLRIDRISSIFRVSLSKRGFGIWILQESFGQRNKRMATKRENRS